MGKELLKWVAGLLSGAAAAAVAYFTANTGSGPAVDPAIALIVVTVLNRLGGLLVGLFGPKAPVV